jgi:8-hydroxy-5-deazaflavin:NADPH oxidoreductase
MKIAIIGAGNVGLALGQRFAELGHQIVFGLRANGSVDVKSAIEGIGHGVKILSVSEAIDEGEVVVLAVPYASALAVVSNEPLLTGKIVIDVTLPLKADYSGLLFGHETSAAEELQVVAPKAHIVKAFNTTGAENMLRPQIDGQRLMMPIASDDQAAKTVVLKLASQLGFDAVDVGALKQARLTEPLGMLWITLAVPAGLGRNIGFSLLRRNPTS